MEANRARKVRAIMNLLLGGMLLGSVRATMLSFLEVSQGLELTMEEILEELEEYELPAFMSPAQRMRIGTFVLSPSIQNYFLCHHPSLTASIMDHMVLPDLHSDCLTLLKNRIQPTKERGSHQPSAPKRSGGDSNVLELGAAPKVRRHF